jgi:S1-C subfamily serine protease
VTQGVLTDYLTGSTYGEPGQVMEISNEVEPGNSGSPVLNSSGSVVGIVFAINELDGAGLAIPASTLHDFPMAPGRQMFGDCVD